MIQADSTRWRIIHKKWFQLKLDTKLTAINFWLLLRPSKYGGIIWKSVSTKSLFLPIITTFGVLWIQKALVFVRFDGSKNFLAIIFGQIIVKEKQMELQTLYLVFLSETMKKKPSFELRTLDPSSFAVFTDKYFNLRAPRHGFKPLASALGPNLQNLHFATALVFLEYPSYRARQWAIL